ncbi:hypothetical protein SNE40_003726 [Patella caerulea]|uniref:Uncharacterized protein n=1 Tax=Patella caerulea TaxID=87958 RepID=A0AAN8K8I9_PATCE
MNILVVVTSIFSATCVYSTVDLNIHELQYVADHLTLKECIKLESALQQKNFQLDVQDPNLYRKPKKGTEKTPCIVRLLKWDRGIARKNTFHNLAIRLKELGFIELSDKLSKTVYHEKAYAIKNNFLKDPFKKLIPTKSSLLEEPKDRRTEDIEPAPTGDPPSTVHMTVWITIASVSFVCMILVGFFVFCPVAFCLIWQKIAPEGCIVGCELLNEQCSFCCKRCHKHYNKHLLGKRKYKSKGRSRSRISLPEGIPLTIEDVNRINPLYNKP